MYEKELLKKGEANEVVELHKEKKDKQINWLKYVLKRKAYTKLYI
jgi:hypothetical protein